VCVCVCVCVCEGTRRLCKNKEQRDFPSSQARRNLSLPFFLRYCSTISGPPDPTWSKITTMASPYTPLPFNEQMTMSSRLTAAQSRSGTLIMCVSLFYVPTIAAGLVYAVVCLCLKTAVQMTLQCV